MTTYKFVIPITVTVNLVDPGEKDEETGEIAFTDAVAQERGAWDWVDSQRDQIECDIAGVEDFVEVEVGDPERLATP